jgi:urease accessory protein
MLLNPTGGVLGGDRLITEIVQEPGTHACLTTPSATRIYRTAAEPAILDTVVRVDDGAFLEYFPDHVIPHVRSALRQSLRVELGRESRAIVIDSLASGRVAHGERWSFTEMDSRIEVHVCGHPAFINRTRIVPAAMRPDRFGLMEDYDYMSCIGIFAGGFARWKELSAAANDLFDGAENIRAAATELSRGGCSVRILARSAPDMTHATKQVWDAARHLIAGLPPFDHRKY